MLERREDARLWRNRRVAGNEARFQLIHVMSGFQAVAQRQTGPKPRHANLVVRIPILVVALDDRNFDRQETPLSGFAVEESHSSRQQAADRNQVTLTAYCLLPTF